MRCDILVLENGEQVLAGSVTYDGGRISSTARPGFERLMKGVMQDKHEVDGKEIGAKGNEVRWFNSLVGFYRGAYLRAKMIE